MLCGFLQQFFIIGWRVLRVGTTCLFCLLELELLLIGANLCTLQWRFSLSPGRAAALPRPSPGHHRWWRREDCCFGCWVFHVSGEESAGSLGALCLDPQDARRAGSCLPTLGPSLLGEHFSSSVNEVRQAWPLSQGMAVLSARLSAGPGGEGGRERVRSPPRNLSCPAFRVCWERCDASFQVRRVGPRGVGRVGLRPH